MGVTPWLISSIRVVLLNSFFFGGGVTGSFARPLIAIELPQEYRVRVVHVLAEGSLEPGLELVYTPVPEPRRLARHYTKACGICVSRVKPLCDDKKIGLKTLPIKKKKKEKKTFQKKKKKKKKKK